MQTYFAVAQIVLSVALILAILLQVRGGGLGGIFGQADSVYRTRRGVEEHQENEEGTSAEGGTCTAESPEVTPHRIRTRSPSRWRAIHL